MLTRCKMVKRSMCRSLPYLLVRVIIPSPETQLTGSSGGEQEIENLVSLPRMHRSPRHKKIPRSRHSVAIWKERSLRLEMMLELMRLGREKTQYQFSRWTRSIRGGGSGVAIVAILCIIVCELFYVSNMSVSLDILRLLSFSTVDQ